ncbi:MAG: hypothetical protein AAGI38_18395 [Bacteroidota bacterium]
MKYISLRFLCVPVIALLLGGCDNDPGFEPINQERTFLHILNTYSGIESLDLYTESLETNRLFAGNVSFMEGWPEGGYATLLTAPNPDSISGEGGVTIRVMHRRPDTALIDPQTLILNPRLYSTIAVIDSFGKAQLVKTIDIFNPPGDSLANLRFMNLNFDFLSVTLRNPDSTILVPGLNFLNYSSFENVPIGTYDFEFVNSLNEQVIETLPQVEIEEGKTYNFYFASEQGLPTANVETLEIVIID